jgi:hypothetical protein
MSNLSGASNRPITSPVNPATNISTIGPNPLAAPGLKGEVP